MAFLFLRSFISEAMIGLVLLFVAGLMITLAIHELLPKALGYKENIYILLGFALGIILIVVNHFIFQLIKWKEIFNGLHNIHHAILRLLI